MADSQPQVDLLHPNGEIYTVPQSSVSQALEAGYKIPTQAQLVEAAKEAKYGERPFSAAAVGAVKSVAPFGVGMSALRGLGVSKETLEGLGEYNPAAETAGEIGGLLVPFSGLGKVAGAAGKGVEAALAGSKLAEKAGVAGKVLEHAGAKAAGSAVEGALYGGSNVLNEAIIGDPNLAAESALSQIGMSALWGAGIGGTLGFAERAIPPAVAKAKELSNKTYNSLGLSGAVEQLKNTAKEGYASLSSVVSGKPKEDILAALANRGAEAVPLETKEITQNLQKHFDQLERVKSDFLKEVTPEAGSELESLLSEYKNAVDSDKLRGDFARQFMYKSKGQLKIDPVKVETFLKNTQTTRGLKGAEALTDFIDSSNKLLDGIEDAYKALPEREFDKASIQGLVDRNQELIERGQKQAVLNRLARGAETDGGHAEPLVAGAAAHLIGLPHAAVGAIYAGFEALKNPALAIQRLAKLEDLINTTQNKVTKAAKVLVKPAKEGAELLKGYAAGKLAITTPEKYHKVTKEITELSVNPEDSVNRFHKNTQELMDHAPNTAKSMQEAGGRALGFLASKIPQKPQQGPLAPKIEPSKAEIASFNRYYQAVEQPLSVLKEAAAGTLTHQGVEVLHDVYPALYQSIKSAVALELVHHKEPLPYKQRLMLSLLMGQDMDGSTSPQAIMDNQQFLEIAAQQEQAKDAAFVGKPRAKGLDNLELSNRALTAQQKAAQRQE